MRVVTVQRPTLSVAASIAILLSASLASRDASSAEEARGLTLASLASSNGNRTPSNTATASFPRFSSAPSDADILAVRLFEEPLVPIGRTTDSENRALARQLMRYIENGGGEALAPFDAFLTAHPASPWRASLLVNLGLVHRRRGHISRALGAWEESWNLSKGAADPSARAVADRALGEYAGLLGRLGREETLGALLADTEGRVIGGSAAEKVSTARDALAQMRTKPERSFRCGPLALDRVLAALRSNYASPKAVSDFPSTSEGTSLAQIVKLANDVGHPMQMAKRDSGSPVTLPAVIHWKSGHFAALVRQRNGFYLVEDATFGEQNWISREAMEAEASGYVIVGAGSLPGGSRAVGEAEGATVWGKGVTTANNPQNFKPCDPKTGCNGAPCAPQGMAVHAIHLMLVSLNITDEPVGYSPPIGPAVRFLATYNQREVYQPQAFQYMNLGPKWTFDWLSYIEDDPAIPPESQSVNLYVRGGGQETYENYDLGTNTYAPHRESRATIERVSPTRYERFLPDGSVEVFEASLGTAPRKVFMTKSSDPQGNAITLGYDAVPFRLATITDAVGRVTTLHYELSDGLKITKITDPFGRFATFDYVGGRLNRITDVIGLESSFEYSQAPGDFISGLTTPYGTTTFVKGETKVINTPPYTIRTRSLQAIDPLGGIERVEYYSNPGPPHNQPYEELPPAVHAGSPPFPNEFLSYRNTFYWDKRAMGTQAGPLDYTKARIYHWLHTWTGMNSGVLESTKAPLESRLWYSYPNQVEYGEGSHGQPNRSGRVLDAGPPNISQISEHVHNLRGKLCQSTDPMGRITRYTYGIPATPNSIPDPICELGSSIDLLKVEQKTGATWPGDVVQTTRYNAAHQPLEVTDAALQTTTYTYLPDGTGRVATVTTPPRSGHDGQALTLVERTTSYEYYPITDPVSPWRLKTVTGPASGLIPGPSVTYTYDAQGHLTATTDSDLYTLTMQYDDFDRLTKTTYPDGTYEETTYNRLDPEGRRDRLGRWSYTYHDALRRVWKTEDPLSRTTLMDWCACGTLDGITDPAGNATTWERDVQGRVTKETRADSKFWEYTYEATTSRLKTIKDPKLQVKTYTYDKDDKLVGIAYTSEVIPTADVNYSFSVGTPPVPDPYGRLRTMIDGTGTTTYSYHAAGTPGALSLASVDGPIAGPGDRLEYSYDELGRVERRQLDGIAHEVTYGFDSLGRLRLHTAPAGTFTFTYDGVTRRPESVVYPNAQRVDYTYYPNNGDHRLQGISNTLPGGAPLSIFGYTYYSAGNIETWSQQRGAGAIATYRFEYDLADQLRHASPSPGFPSYDDSYDDAGNRTSHSVGSSTSTATYSNRNWILASGTPPSAPTLYTHDANGNLMSDATSSYTWDAEDRLVAVIRSGSTVASFAYDGNGRRQARTSLGVTHAYIHDGTQVVEERLSTGGTIKYFDGPGTDHHLATQDSAGTVSYFASDHLGSVTDVTTSGGAVSLIRAYDPWGNLLIGGSMGGYAFTGREWDSETGLYYYRARYYDPKIGRFISEDPIGFNGGINYYAYAANNPASWSDPSGLKVTNNSDCTIFVKPEETGDAIPLGPGQVHPDQQDGIAVPESHPGQVYKTRNYTDVVVNKGGDVSSSGPISWILNIRAGWMPKGWRPDAGWDALIAASNTEPDCEKKSACSR